MAIGKHIENIHKNNTSRLKKENHTWSRTTSKWERGRREREKEKQREKEREKERLLLHVFFMLEIIDFLIAIVESTADIHWPTEFITAVLMHLSQTPFSTELENIWIFGW